MILPRLHYDKAAAIITNISRRRIHIHIYDTILKNELIRIGLRHYWLLHIIMVVGWLAITLATRVTTPSRHYTPYNNGP